MLSPINHACLQLKVRAERYNREHLIQTYVDIGPLLTLLLTEDHQILYGRRGTGKTHALEYLANEVRTREHIAATIDMRTIGSNGGIYNDQTIPLPQRATRLVVDTLLAVHEQILDAVVERDELFDLSKVGPLLDQFVTSATGVVIKGVVAEENSSQDSHKETSKLEAKASFGGTPNFELLAALEESQELKRDVKRTATGVEHNRIHFGTLFRDLTALCAALGEHRIWIILDEWSEVPLDLQPYLADLFRRTIIPVKAITLKIGAIEQRTNFRENDENGSYIGVEVGADLTANTNLDDFMVFDNDQERASGFFENFLYKHIANLLPEGYLKGSNKPQELLRQMFTQSSNAFGEFVRAAEGVPRDAINILNLSAQQALDNPISIPNIRSAAKRWYQQGKEQAIQDPQTKALLRWIIDEVIAHRQARAFLLRSDSRHRLIDLLFDARVLHVVKRGVSSNDTPGVRYDVYSIDYGCYVDLMNTARAPKGLFDTSDDDTPVYSDVPANDYRSIRRAILDLEEFDKAHS